jgi:hypothetical protein
VAINEAHAAHVRGKLIDDGGTFGHGAAILLVLQVKAQILRAIDALMPRMERLVVDGADGLHPIVNQALDQVAYNEAARPADDHGLLACVQALESG